MPTGTPVTSTSLIVILQEAEVYFAGRLRTEAWDYATEDEKTKALLMATRAFGALSWEDGEMPDNDDIKNACCEEALALLLEDSELEDLHLVSETVAGISTTVDPNMPRPWVAHDLSSPKAWKLIAPYLVDLKSFKIIRG